MTKREPNIQVGDLVSWEVRLYRNGGLVEATNILATVEVIEELTRMVQLRVDDGTKRLVHMDNLLRPSL